MYHVLCEAIVLYSQVTLKIPLCSILITYDLIISIKIYTHDIVSNTQFMVYIFSMSFYGVFSFQDLHEFSIVWKIYL